MMKFTFSRVLLLSLSVMMVPELAFAEPGRDESADRMRPPKQPPVEAIEACEGKSVGDVASFTSPRGDEVQGTCKEIHNMVVLVPDHPPHDHPPRDREDGDAGSAPHRPE